MRDDSILVQPPPHSWYHAEMPEKSWPRLAVILEHQHYTGHHRRSSEGAHPLPLHRKNLPRRCQQPFIRAEALDIQISASLTPFALRADWAEPMFEGIAQERRETAQKSSLAAVGRREEMERIRVHLKRLPSKSCPVCDSVVLKARALPGRFNNQPATHNEGATMNVIAENEEVWVASLTDKPGALGEKLAALAEVGADLGFIIARRSHEKAGTGVVFVTPLRGDREIEAATEEGFSVSSHLHSVRLEGRNEPGVAGKVAQKIGKAGLNLRGFSGAVIGTQFVLHLAFDTAEAAKKAIAVLQS